ncbi:LysR family transcriptional regulator [Pseudooceanicola spongiae]|uniref:LysR family transcriptional regulator n=1 Tax=Pseudooceanicola spongiae TaxID=2613965 RepID=A0A7L9WNL8_9RHOB|nr:LysR family transcriptional regulator [Pseudooceanicola spongiae]QOL81995.1 LysR family transcriptional regulator [Pseudooceanicola spongiae]
MYKVRELQAFDAYMRLGSVKLAADEIAAGQPMVSRMLQSLEGNIGFTLFVRKRNKLVPTSEAFRFHQMVSQHLSGLRMLEQEAIAIANGQVGHLTIAAQPIFCDTFLLDALSQFRETNPDVSVKIIDVGMAEMLHMISARSCDMAFGITLNPEAFGGATLPLAHCEARCILPKGHPLGEAGDIPLPRLRRERFVDLAEGSPLRHRIDNMMETINVQRDIVTELRTLHGVVKLVERGLGVAIVDPVALQLVDATKATAHRLIPPITWEIAQFTPQDRPLSGIGEAFSDVVSREIDKLKARGLVS